MWLATWGGSLPGQLRYKFKGGGKTCQAFMRNYEYAKFLAIFLKWVYVHQHHYLRSL